MFEVQLVSGLTGERMGMLMRNPDRHSLDINYMPQKGGR